VYKRGLGTLVLKRRSYLLPSLVTSVSAYYIVVEGGKVLNAGPMNNVLISVGKFSRTDAGPTPEFILEDTPDAAIVGTTFVTAGNINSLNPGLGIFTQNGGTVNPGVGWDTRIALVFTTAFVGTSGTGIYNLVNGTLTVTNSLRFGKNGSVNNGHYGIFNQAGGTADLQRVAGAWGEWNLTGGLFRLGTADADVGTNVTFKLGGGRLEPKTATWLVLRSPTVFTGINGDATLAPASGQTIQLSSAATSSGSGGFVKEGAGLLYLSNTNAFAGTADIHAGTCTVTAAGCLTQCSNLLVAAGAHLTFQRSGAALNTNLWLKVAADGKVHLDFTNEVEVGHLVLGGSEQPGRGRRYGSASHATPLEAVKGDFFTGTGVLKVVGPRGPEGTLLSLR
jgi:autotransporter-associated beta strand protein